MSSMLSFVVHSVVQVDDERCIVQGMCGDRDLYIGDVLTVVYVPVRIHEADDDKLRFMRTSIRPIIARIESILLYGHSLDHLDHRIETISAQLVLVGSGISEIREGDVIARD